MVSCRSDFSFLITEQKKVRFYSRTRGEDDAIMSCVYTEPDILIIIDLKCSV